MKLFGLLRFLLLITCASSIMMPPQRDAHSQVSNGASDIAWSPDGTQLAVSGDFGVAFYDSDFELIDVMVDQDVDAIDWSPDGTTLAVLRYKVVEVWDIQSEQLKSTLTLADSGRDVSWSPNGQYLAVREYATIQVFDATTLTEVFTHDVNAQLVGMAWSPDETKLAGLASLDMIVWEASTGNIDFSIDLIEADHASYPFHLAWHPDGTKIAIGMFSSHGPVAIFDVASRMVVDYGSIAIGRSVFMEWSPNGEWFANATDGQLYLNSISGIEHFITPNSYSDNFRTGDWKPDSMQVAMVVVSASIINDNRVEDGSVHIYDVETGDELAGPQMPKGERPTITIENPTPRQIAEQKAMAGITLNADWEPFSSTFNSVEMVLVPAGCFEMGRDPAVDKFLNWGTYCFPPFWIDRFEVTYEQYARFIQAEGYDTPVYWSEEGRAFINEHLELTVLNYTEDFSNPNYPVALLKYEADAYASWRGCRIPTEQEWEYVGRGPDNLFFPWGNEFDLANIAHDGLSNIGSRPSGASWVGAMDMAGNISEWTDSNELSKPPNDVVGNEPLEIPDPYIFMVRGGPYSGNADFTRLAQRWVGSVFFSRAGLRLVCSF